jgi:ACR3 family arsenite efflux pump ArsB
LVAWLERRQIPLYLAALVVGGLIGTAFSGAADEMEMAINPALALLLYATFLAVPLAAITRSWRDVRFVTAAVVLNFAVVPVVVFALTRFVASDTAVLVGALLVLLAPCIDYVIVFTRIAGGAHERLLAVAPLLMVLQMLLLPLYLFLFVGSDLADIIEAGPFVEALVVLIVIPLTAAALTQALARRSVVGERIMDLAEAAMVPLMMLVLGLVVGSQIGEVRAEAPSLIGAAAIYAAFLLIMALLGTGLARLFRLDVASSRALAFTGATRNSLVVLPLALALPERYELAAAVVVTQTLVELIGMVTYVRVVPRLIPSLAPMSAAGVSERSELRTPAAGSGPRSHQRQPPAATTPR